MLRKSVLILGLVLMAAPVLAHPGRTNSSGCHNDRKNGGYHCHVAPLPKQVVPAKAEPAPRKRVPAKITCYLGAETR